MPRVVKGKGSAPTGVSGAPKKAAAPAKRKNKLYAMPEKIAEGTILQDTAKGQWRIGPSIGTGGFGEIYSACRVGEKNYEYVVKCEPHGNGPLFVEMHFYMRNARLEDIERFKKEHSLKSLGMPYMVGNGSTEINGQKHRFIVIPRYGSDVAYHFLANGRRLPEVTAYRLALQMLDVYEFIHSCGYVHADLKAANILLGYGKGGNAQAYLVDYGLASHYTTKQFKPDPKKMHNGTIEYTSRDAHHGVATMRADFEILGYNLIEWLGVQLPWVRDNLLTAPAKVQQAKESFMHDVGTNLKSLFAHGAPAPIADFMKYVAAMKYNDTPNYEKCRKMFEAALKTMKMTNTGDLDFKLKSGSNNNLTPTGSRNVGKGRGAAAKAPVAALESSDEEICASEDDDGNVIFEQKRPIKVAPTKKPLKASAKPTKKVVSPPGKVKRKEVSPLKTDTPTTSAKVNSPVKATRLPASKHVSPTRQSPNRKRVSPVAANLDRSPASKKPRTDTNSTKSPLANTSRGLRATPASAKANINFSPGVTVSRSSSLARRHGKTVINDNLTPSMRAGKTYEFNFELDVSVDANVIVNVNRKKKAAHAPPHVNGHHSASGSKQTSGDPPVTRVKVRKLASADNAGGSPRTPAVTVKKSRRVVS